MYPRASTLDCFLYGCWISPVEPTAFNCTLSKSNLCLNERCYACHGALKQKAGLRLDSVTLMERGSNNGNVLDVEGKDLPPLFQRLISTDL